MIKSEKWKEKNKKLFCIFEKKVVPLQRKLKHI